MKIKFTRDTLASEGDIFEAGAVEDLAPASAERWLRRGAAEVYVAPSPPKKKPTFAKRRTKKGKYNG